MNLETKEIYSEVYQLLNLLGNEYICKLPSSLFDMLKEKRDINYTPTYTEDMLSDRHNIRKETISIIVLLYLNYWCENEKEKLELKQILKSNEDKFQTKLKEKYNSNDIFLKRSEKQKKEESNIDSNTLMIPYKEPIFNKIINKIKRYISDKF